MNAAGFNESVSCEDFPEVADLSLTELQLQANMYDVLSYPSNYMVHSMILYIGVVNVSSILQILMVFLIIPATISTDRMWTNFICQVVEQTIVLKY